ncbi:hypothetical protein HAX54_001925, partial [Datura stramonium]|nr:hypothetical protein [Datura stramonium]
HFNVMAQIKRATHGMVDMNFILGVDSYDLDRVDSEVQSEGSHCRHKHEDGHEHHKGYHHDHVHDFAVSSVSIASEGAYYYYEVFNMLFAIVVLFSIVFLFILSSSYKFIGIWVALTIYMSLRASLAGLWRIGTGTGPWKFLKS